ncbi:hypothetical protein VPH35_050168 [Triticum aestivum]|uniref:Uncharacterized protein n=1 Tax=Triticum aestivum TaxID=4565 RepID=A0A077RQ91_WHEAT|nr:unnamed protein product [Triticum aestivum]
MWTATTVTPCSTRSHARSSSSTAPSAACSAPGTASAATTPPTSPLSSLSRPHPSCVGVGNNGILLRHAHDALIDSHHAVFRPNIARIIGYTTDIIVPGLVDSDDGRLVVHRHRWQR